jgi:rhodanese-related sulfurtransferase
MSGGKTVAQLLAEAAAKAPFMSMEELSSRLGANSADLVILDLREKDQFEGGRIPGAHHLPRGQLELRVNSELPDPTVRIVTCCEFGKISTLAAATLRELGYARVSALDGGVKAWRDGGFPLEN